MQHCCDRVVERTHQLGSEGSLTQGSLHPQKWPILRGSECVVVKSLRTKNKSLISDQAKIIIKKNISVEFKHRYLAWVLQGRQPEWFQ